MNYSDFLKTRIVNRSGLIQIFLPLFYVVLLLLYLPLFVATTHAHKCGSSPIEIDVDETVTWQITADVLETKTTYTPGTYDSHVVLITPNIEFSGFHGVFTITGLTAGTTSFSVPWVNNEGTGGSGTCTVSITVKSLTTGGGSSANYVYSAYAKDPINTYTGELYDSYSPDLNLGGPIPLFFRRYYASGLKDDGVTGNMGDNWLHNFEWTMTLSGTNATIISNKGRNITFSKNSTSWDLTGKTDIVYQLDENSGVFTLLDPRNWPMYKFDASGLLTGIEDGKGNDHTRT